MLHGGRGLSRVVQTTRLAKSRTLQCRRLQCVDPFQQCHRRCLLTLAIETSCDDTAVAILETTGTTLSSRQHDRKSSTNSTLQNLSSRKALSDIGQKPHASTYTTRSNEETSNAPPQDDISAVSARILFHEKVTARNTGLGGIHPLEALESHQENLARLIRKAITFLPDATATKRPHRPRNASQDKASPEKRPPSLQQPTTKVLPDFVTVTRGPGMRSNLACGIDTAKGLAVAWQVPLLGVHHMQAHTLTPRLVDALQRGDKINEEQQQQQVKADETNQIMDGQATTSSLITISSRIDLNDETRSIHLQPEFPFLTLLVSGGHTMLVHSKGLVDHQIIATTRDVAIGDALDKCGRIILPDEVRSEMQDTAFAKYLSEWASDNNDSADLWPIPKRRQDEIDKPNNEYGWQVQAPLADTKDMAFSFTSIATQIERIFKQRSSSTDGHMSLAERQMFARTALGVSFEHLCSRTVIAIKNLRAAGHDISTLVVSGGVAANSFLRHFLQSMLDARGLQNVNLLFPPPWLCTDNAVMIAWTGVEMFEAGFQSQLDIRAVRKWSMDSSDVDGGIIGIEGWTRPALYT